MDNQFVDVIVDTYLSQYGLYESRLPKKREAQKTELVTEFMGYLRELRDTDIEIYDAIYDRNRIMQQDIIYEYLHDISESWKDSINTDTLKKVGKYGAAAALGAAAWDAVDDVPDVDNGSGMFSKLGDFLSNISYKKFFMDPANYAAVGFGVMLFYRFIKSDFVNKNYEKVFFKINETFYKLSKTLKKSRPLTFRYVILKQNYEQCYKQCGIDIKNIKKGHFNWLTSKTDKNGKDARDIGSNKEQSKQAENLKECYLSFTTQTIGLLCSNYLLCINTNKQIEQAYQYSADDFILGFDKKPEANSTCKSLYDVFQSAIEEFKQLAEYLSKLENRHQTYNDCMDQLKKSINKQLLMTTQK